MRCITPSVRVFICSEKIVIPMEKEKIILQGNNPLEVIVQYNDAGQASSSGPMIVNAEYFVAINVTFKVRVYIYSCYQNPCFRILTNSTLLIIFVHKLSSTRFVCLKPVNNFCSSDFFFSKLTDGVL